MHVFLVVFFKFISVNTFHILKHYQLNSEKASKMGRARGAVSVMWTIQTCGILCACGGILAACVFLKFVMVPLIMAYFVTFLMAPITDVMEKRPYQ